MGFCNVLEPHMTPAALPLEGIRILDFTRVLAGPLHRPAGGSGRRGHQDRAAPGRRLPRHWPHAERRKRAVHRDEPQQEKHGARPQIPEAVALVHAMAAQADVVVENFRPGVAERLGIGAAALQGLNLKLVVVSVSGFGQTGPLAHRPAYDIIVQAMSGD